MIRIASIEILLRGYLSSALPTKTASELLERDSVAGTFDLPARYKRTPANRDDSSRQDVNLAQPASYHQSFSSGTSAPDIPSSHKMLLAPHFKDHPSLSFSQPQSLPLSHHHPDSPPRLQDSRGSKSVYQRRQSP